MEAVGIHVLVKPKELETQTQTGIHIVRLEEVDHKEGEVISIGKRVDNPEFSIGDTVFFSEFGAVPYEIKGEKYLAVPYQNIDLAERKQ